MKRAVSIFLKSNLFRTFANERQKSNFRPESQG